MSDQVQIDVVQSNGDGGMTASGSIADRLLQSGFNVNALRPQTTLRKDEWLALDNTVTEVAQQRLTGVADLVGAGLTYNLPNAMGKTRLEWETQSDMDPAEVSMAGVTQGQNDRIDFGLQSMPIPIVHKEFSLNIRALSASREPGGSPLDTTQAALAARKVSETLENILFSGTNILGSAQALYGYTTAPNRNTGSVTASWLTATGTQIVTDILRMINAANADKYYGPFVIYVPLAVYTHFSEDFKADSDRTILERITAIPNIQAIRPAEFLTGTNVIMAQLTRDVLDIVDGIRPTTVQWESQGGFIQHFKVLAIMPPRFKSTYTTQSGIVHFS